MKFLVVQGGEAIINLAHVVEVAVDGDELEVTLSSGNRYTLEDEDAEKFLAAIAEYTV